MKKVDINEAEMAIISLVSVGVRNHTAVSCVTEYEPPPVLFSVLDHQTHVYSRNISFRIDIAVVARVRLTCNPFEVATAGASSKMCHVIYLFRPLTLHVDYYK